MRTLGRAMCVVLLLLAGCQQEMAKQPSYRPLQPSDFFADGRASRPEVPGTIAQGHLRDDPLLFNGREPGRRQAVEVAALIGFVAATPPATVVLAGNTPQAFAALDYADVYPFPIDLAALQRGRERYTIFCAVCHDPAGRGNGKIVERGFTKPPSYHTDRTRGFERRGYNVLLRDVPAGYYFEVITKGFGAMPDHAAQIPPHDRWLIVAYIRALQLSQHARLEDLPPAARESARKALEAKP